MISALKCIITTIILIVTNGVGKFKAKFGQVEKCASGMFTSTGIAQKKKIGLPDASLLQMPVQLLGG